MERKILTGEEVLAAYRPTFWKKNASTRIKKIVSQADLDTEPEHSFLDLEGRRHHLAIGRCICIGVEGERWTCSLSSLERDRDPVGEVDAQGYQEYKMKNPRSMRCFDIPFPFILVFPGKAPWNCEDQDGAIITWNGKTGDLLDMRVIKRSVFEATYSLQEGEQA